MNPQVFTTPCGFFVVIGKKDDAVKVNIYWQDKPVDLNNFELSIAGAKMIGSTLLEMTKEAPNA